jgi:glycosyltransferase involved in cell wall biosynthesis
LVRQGHDVSLYTTNVDGSGHLDVPVDRPVLSEGVKIYHFRGWNPPGNFVISRDMWRALRENIANFDIAHIWGVYGFTTTAAAYWCRKRSIPYVAFPHGSLDPFLRRRNRPRKWIYTKLFAERDYRRAAAVMFTTEEELRLASDWSGLQPAADSPNPKPRHIITYTGIGSEWLQEPNQEAGLRFREKYPELKHRKLVVYLGRINFKKGLDILARAFAKLARDRDDIRLVLAGPDSEGYGPTVKALLVKGGVEHKAIFTGMLGGDERLSVLQQADVFALPSYTENFGQAVFEAMASGAPVVISDQVNVWPEVKNANAGIIVPCDADATAQALETILDDPAQAKKMGQNGRRWVINHLSWDLVAVKMAQAYEETIRAYRARHPQQAGVPVAS